MAIIRHRARLILACMICLLTGSVMVSAAEIQPQPLRRDYWALVAVQTAAGITDAELTRYRIRQNPAWRELNPFLPHRPSRHRMYLQGAAVLIVINYAAYRLERSGHRRWARALQAIPIAGFIWGIQQNARHGPHRREDNIWK